MRSATRRGPRPRGATRRGVGAGGGTPAGMGGAGTDGGDEVAALGVGRKVLAAAPPRAAARGDAARAGARCGRGLELPVRVGRVLERVVVALVVRGGARGRREGGVVRRAAGPAAAVPSR